MGNIIQSAGGTMSVASDLPPAMEVDVAPELQEAVRAPKGVRFVATGLRRLGDWRTFFPLLESTPLSTQPKLFSHSGHVSVAKLTSDIPIGRSKSTTLARTTIRRICGALSQGTSPRDVTPLLTPNAIFLREPLKL
jgi:hypothetical protein